MIVNAMEAEQGGREMPHFKFPGQGAIAMIGLLTLGALAVAGGARGELLDDFTDGNDTGWTRFTLPFDLPDAY